VSGVHIVYTMRTAVSGVVYEYRLWAEGRHARTKSCPDLDWTHIGEPPS